MKLRASRREQCTIRDARDREVADWLDRHADKVRHRLNDAATATAIEGLSATLRAGLVDQDQQHTESDR